MIAILGAGRFGGTLAKILSERGHDVTVFCPEEEAMRLDKERVIPHTDGARLPDEVKVCFREKDLAGFELVFLAVPGECLREAWKEWGPRISTIVVNVAKMMECVDGRLALAHNIVYRPDTFGQLVSAAFPQGLLRGHPTMGTIFTQSEQVARLVQSAFPQEILRLYPSKDIVGGEIGGALKNVIGLAAGMQSVVAPDPMTLGTLISRGAHEIRVFGETHGARAETFGPGSVFWADLIGTCHSELSHNWQAGRAYALGNRKVISEIGTVEGIHTLSVLAQIPGTLKNMPICHAVSQVVLYDRSPEEAMRELLARPLKET